MSFWKVEERLHRESPRLNCEVCHLLAAGLSKLELAKPWILMTLSGRREGAYFKKIQQSVKEITPPV